MRRKADPSSGSLGWEVAGDVVTVQVVSRDYFQVRGIPLVAGRTFTAEEERFGARTVVVGAALAGTGPFPEVVQLPGPSAGSYRVVGILAPYEQVQGSPLSGSGGLRVATGVDHTYVVPLPLGVPWDPRFDPVRLPLLPVGPGGVSLWVRPREGQEHLVLRALEEVLAELRPSVPPHVVPESRERSPVLAATRPTLDALRLISWHFALLLGVWSVTVRWVYTADRLRAVGVRRAMGATRVRVVVHGVAGALGVGLTGIVLAAGLVAVLRAAWPDPATPLLRLDAGMVRTWAWLALVPLGVPAALAELRVAALPPAVLLRHVWAEDAVKDAFCAVFRSIRTLRDPGRFSAWLATIVRRESHRHWVRHRRSRDCVQALDAGRGAGPAAPAGPARGDPVAGRLRPGRRGDRPGARRPGRYGHIPAPPRPAANPVPVPRWRGLDLRDALIWLAVLVSTGTLVTASLTHLAHVRTLAAYVRALPPDLVLFRPAAGVELPVRLVTEEAAPPGVALAW